MQLVTVEKYTNDVDTFLIYQMPNTRGMAYNGQGLTKYFFAGFENPSLSHRTKENYLNLLVSPAKKYFL